MNDAIRAGLCCPHNYLRNRYGLCADCKKGHPMTTEEIVDEKTGQKLVKQKKRKPKAEEKPAPKPSAKMRQASLPGTKTKAHEDIDEAAAAYCEVRDERIECSKRESEAKRVLLERMKKHDVREYVSGKVEITREVVEEKLKVKLLDDEEDA